MRLAVQQERYGGDHPIVPFEPLRLSAPSRWHIGEQVEVTSKVTVHALSYDASYWREQQYRQICSQWRMVNDVSILERKAACVT